jgi:hypothetical protein
MVHKFRAWETRKARKSKIKYMECVLCRSTLGNFDVFF